MAVNYSSLAHEITNDRSWLKEVVVVLGASIIIALFARVSIPWVPIPLATQAQVILVLSCFLGAKRASLAVLTFLAQGLMGLPVFAGGAAGMAIFTGPRGGYLLGYLAAAFVTGVLIERMSNRTPFKAFAAMGVGNLVVYLFGLPWLSQYVGWQNVFMVGMAPFIIGDLIKLVVATKSLKALGFFSSLRKSHL